jgi:hypothetical protein
VKLPWGKREMRKNVFSENRNGRDQLGEIGVLRKLLKSILKEQG